MSFKDVEEQQKRTCLESLDKLQRDTKLLGFTNDKTTIKKKTVKKTKLASQFSAYKHFGGPT